MSRRFFAVTICSALVFAMLAAGMAAAQPKGFNYDESKVPKYTLPDPMLMENGRKVTDAKTWRDKRRPEVLKLFQQYVYGKAPTGPKELSYEIATKKNALGGIATRKQVTVFFAKGADAPRMDILIYLPNKTKKPVATFVGLNFNGNQAIHSDPEIRLPTSWMRNNKERGVVNNRASEKSRGISSSRWPVEQIIKRGYAVATIYCGDIDPDYHDEFQNGVHPLFYGKGQTKPKPGQWGTISAWAWGLSRAMDYFETDDDIDHRHVAVMGHSRLGKTALWAGARDERFALVISNNSGCGGAALSRRSFGETVQRINTAFPHWFCGNFQKFNGREDELPVDQHMLVALIAPRPVLVCSAEEDRWADPHGEFLSAKGADAVYRLLGTDGMVAKKMPGLNEPITSTIGYRIRPGKHDVLPSDWQAYMDFADKHFGR